MGRISGMTIKQFNDVIKDMKTIYPFEDDKARLADTRDVISCAERHVEVLVKDERTDITIVMSKDIDIWENKE